MSQVMVMKVISERIDDSMDEGCTEGIDKRVGEDYKHALAV